MAIKESHCSLTTFFLVCLAAGISGQTCNPACKAKPPFNCDNVQIFNQQGFSKNFTWGVATSAYQTEGTSDRAPNNWDYFTHRFHNNGNADLATDSYHLYKDDVAMLKKLNVNGYRFSIAWSRVLPKGRLNGGVDEKGIMYYNNLINHLKANGIEPFVTIFHWDFPQTLEDSYQSFLSRRIVDDFRDYAELLFQRFGDRVKNWITLNQPYSLATKGYGDGSYPPGRCTDCEFGGDSGTEPYIVAHNQLLAHAETVALYRNKYQRSQGGQIGTTLIGRWFVPFNESSAEDHAAAQRAVDFFFGWFMDPLVFGDYPQVMKDLVGDRLPKFTQKESSLLKGSFDFLGLNYYLTQYAKNAPAPDPEKPNASKDMRAEISYSRNGVPIGEVTASFMYYPPGFRHILEYVKTKYNNPLTYITENGMDDRGSLTRPELIADNGRIQYHCSHLSCLKCAIENGSNVAGYFAWSFLDNYEFGAGYDLRFGMYYVNFTNPKDREIKQSGIWYSKFIKANPSVIIDNVSSRYMKSFFQ